MTRLLKNGHCIQKILRCVFGVHRASSEHKRVMKDQMQLIGWSQANTHKSEVLSYRTPGPYLAIVNTEA